jgi:type III secretory pathway component EscV
MEHTREEIEQRLSCAGKDLKSRVESASLLYCGVCFAVGFVLGVFPQILWVVALAAVLLGVLWFLGKPETDSKQAKTETSTETKSKAPVNGTAKAVKTETETTTTRQ